MFELSKIGTPIPISSTCAVFNEFEIILMGQGRAKEDIASGVVHSIANKVVGQQENLEMKRIYTFNRRINFIW